MTERTNVAKMNREPVIVSLGGKDYEIHPQNLLIARAWKAKARPIIDKMEGVMNIMTKVTSDTETIDITEVFSHFKSLLFSDMDAIIDLVFEWDETLPKDEILASADEMEMLEAFKEVLALAFPFLKTLGLNLSSVSLNELVQSTAGASTTSTP